MTPSNSTPWWGITWAWVCGYSSLATIVVVFNTLILFSVVTNKYLHYSFNYVLVILSIRCKLSTVNTFLILKCPLPIQGPYQPSYGFISSYWVSVEL